MARFSPEYLDYMQSPEWEAVRQQKLEEANYQCERCGRRRGEGWVLQVHHWTYERLFHEDPEDLEVLCEEHHEQADDARRAGLTRYEWMPHMSGVRGTFRKVGESAPPVYRYKVVKEDDDTWRVGISFMRSENVVADGIIEEGMARGLCDRIRGGGLMIADLAIIRATKPRQMIDGF